MIASDYAIIAASIYAARLSYWLYPLAVFVIAGRQHSLLIFMHEAAHVSLSRQRWLNDLLGNVLCAWPMLLDVGAFRHVHLQHHRHEGGAGDPDFAFRNDKDWSFPRPLHDIVWSIARDLVGLNAFDALRQVRYYGAAPREARVWMSFAKVCFYLLVLSALYLTGALTGFFLFWLVPILTALKCFVRIREIAEHYGLPAHARISPTRTTETSWLESALIAPRNINYHVEHHLFPGVPWHSLPELRRALLCDPRYAEGTSLSASYWAALQDCAGASVLSKSCVQVGECPPL